MWVSEKALAPRFFNNATEKMTNYTSTVITSALSGVSEIMGQTLVAFSASFFSSPPPLVLKVMAFERSVG